ncbi:unnamed protein product [Heligmosomoides polygyrus]|uniref:Neur_chan_LBD domain-containing protein n=1 Tax=Heligmosomoides polygyrus TaxID=6339 RepID=A0A183GVH7_HELPZ|nr:unnamed protein product [Heligmosomoides polygyrus]
MQTIRFAMDVTMQWVDPLLVWTPTAGSGLTILKIITHPCRIDIAHFPYDIQTCELSIGSWSFSTDSMQLFTPFDSYQPSDDFTGNSEWELLSFTSTAELDTSYEEADFGMVSVMSFAKEPF